MSFFTKAISLDGLLWAPLSVVSVPRDGPLRVVILEDCVLGLLLLVAMVSSWLVVGGCGVAMLGFRWEFEVLVMR